MKKSYLLVAGVLSCSLGLSFSETMGMTPEDACHGSSENDPCEYKDPNQYTAYGTCQWSAAATEAPHVTEAPNPALKACQGSSYSDGSACSFVDLTTLMEIDGTCMDSPGGLLCEAEAGTETKEDEACDGINVNQPCLLVYADGSAKVGNCTDTGGDYLKCEVEASSSGGSGDSGNTGDGGAVTEPSQIACLKDVNITADGFVLDGTACSYTQADGQKITGTCVSKAGGAYSACESKDIGTATENPSMPDEAPDKAACDGRSENDACLLIDEVDNTNMTGLCEVAPATGDLHCVPDSALQNRRGLTPIFLYCKSTSGGGDVTDAPTTDNVDLGQQGGDDVTFEDGAGAVVGGVIGGLLGVAALVVGGIFIYRKYGSRRLGVDIDTEGGDVYQTL